MFAQMSLAMAVSLITLSALGYAIATAGMKLASHQWTTAAAFLMITGLMAATAGEIVLLRQSNLAIIYICILAVESLLILGLAAFWGDHLSISQLSGAALVLIGLFFVTQ